MGVHECDEPSDRDSDPARCTQQSTIPRADHQSVGEYRPPPPLNGLSPKETQGRLLPPGRHCSSSGGLARPARRQRPSPWEIRRPRS